MRGVAPEGSQGDLRGVAPEGSQGDLRGVAPEGRPQGDTARPTESNSPDRTGPEPAAKPSADQPTEDKPGNSTGETASPSPNKPAPSTPTPSVAGANVPDRVAQMEALTLARGEIHTQLDGGKFEEAVPSIDGLFSDELSIYTGEPYQVNADVRSIKQFQEHLSEIERITGKTTAIAYVLARPDQLDLVLVTPRGKSIYKSVPEAKREQLLEVLQQFRSELTNVRKRNTNSYLPYAQQLYQWLIAPIAEELEKLDTDILVFSMDAGLRSLPIAALHDGEQFLIEKYSVGLIPSLLLTDTAYQSLENAQVLAFGASEFAQQAPLPAVPVELQTITQELWTGKAFLNQDFTLDNLIAQRRFSPAAIVHLATHAEFNPGLPQNSYIQLWNEQLTLDNLRTLGWNNPQVELLVLSACRTAVGDLSAELGFAGLAVQAGVKTALASLWYVSDEGTLALMTQFYDHLKNTAIKSDALREAQIAMLRGEVRIEGGELRGSRGGNVSLPPILATIPEKTLAHPYYWSGFTMIGSPW